MGYLANAIGPYTFDNLRGTYQAQQTQVEVFQRPGVDGSGIRRLGVKGKPFTVTTERFETSRAYALQVTNFYYSLVGQDPVDVVERGIAIGAFQVLGIERVAIQPVTTVAGPTIVTNPTVNLVVTWTLLAMPNNTAED